MSTAVKPLATYRDALGHACPSCGAAVGRRCLTVSGARTSTLHVTRKQRANRLI